MQSFADGTGRLQAMRDGRTVFRMSLAPFIELRPCFAGSSINSDRSQFATEVSL